MNDFLLKCYLKGKVDKEGKDYVEQRFATLIKKCENELDEENKKSLYKYLFPKLVLSHDRINEIFENVVNSEKNNFVPKYHKSELLYFDWVHSFYNSPLIHTKKNDDFVFNEKLCNSLLKEYKDWFGSLQSNEKIEYLSTNFVLNLNPKDLVKWLLYFGITISKTTAQAMLDYGMPVGHRHILPFSLFAFTKSGNGLGIVGVLASFLYLIKNSHSKYYHPLNDSLVLALARMESYLNTRI